MSVPHTVTRKATEHGWLRRPELDGKTWDAWELPDGGMYIVPKGQTPQVATLTGQDRRLYGYEKNAKP
jgi:hypothetical protein